MAQMVMELLMAGHDVFSGVDTAEDRTKSDPERFMATEGVFGGLSTGVGLGAKVAGGLLEAGALTEAGAIAMSGGGVLATGAMGYEFGTLLDKKYHLSDKASDAMVGSMPSRMWDQSKTVTADRGTEGIAAANRAAEAHHIQDGNDNLKATTDKMMLQQELQRHWVL